MARLERVRDGIGLHLDATEVEVVATLAEGLARRAEGGGPDAADPVLDRLAPTASRGDVTADAELRPMLRDELLAMRASRLDDLVALLRAPTDEQRTDGGGFGGILDRDGAMRVVEALNDLRLALAVTIGYDEELRGSLDDDDQRGDAVRLMDALAWLQGGLIEFITGDPSD